MSFKTRLTAKLAVIASSLALAVAAAFAQAPPIGQGGAAPAVPLFSQGSKNFSTGPAPVVTGGGAPTVLGNDNSGQFTVTATTAVTLTFASGWPFPPACVVMANTAFRAFTVTALTISIPGATAGDVISYWCVGRLG
jgi:hypothetical protein